MFVVRVFGKRQQRIRSEVDAEELAEDVEDAPVGEIIRVKRFEVNPMGPEEAIEQMELLQHDFFLFYNPEEAAINLVYRRRDGNYGLLQPEVP